MEAVLARFGINKPSIVEMLWSFVPELASAFGMVFLVVLFYVITARLTEVALRQTAMQESLIRITVRSLYRGIVILVGIILVLGELGVNVTAAVAGVGVLGIAVGFAAQATIANILAGFGIFVDDLYRKGHWVRLAENYGEVIDITLRVTKIRTLDNAVISLPNSLVTNSPLVNLSEQGLLRITAKVRIGFGESIDNARTVLLKAIRKMNGVVPDPEPTVVVEAIGDFGIDLLIRVWVVEPGFEQKYYFKLTELCKQVLDGAKINIPFPQQDVRIIKGRSTKQIATKKK